MTGGYQVMPGLTDEEFADLEQSIKADGVLVPIIVTEDGEIIDGHHRAKIARKLGVHCPEVVKHGDPTELRTFAYSLNLHRRHLTREQKRELIAQSLRQDPGLPDVQHAKRTGVSDKTVTAVRHDLEGRSEIPNVDTRTDSMGRQQPATKPPTVDAEAEAQRFAQSDAEYARQAADMEAQLRAERDAVQQPNPAVTAFLESSQAVSDSGYLREFTRTFARADDFLRFTAERLGPLLDQGEFESLEMYAVSVSRFVDTVRRSRSGLRVINGGN